MPRALYLGIDNSQPNVIRVVCLVSEDLLDTWPLCWTSSKSLEAFKAFWRENIGGVDAAAATILEHDTFGILNWLNERGVNTPRYHRRELDDILEWAAPLDDEMSRAYRRAHALAMRAAFDAEGSQVAGQMYEEIHSLRNRVDALEQAAQRLNVMLHCPF
jgi:hypothetical protein